MKTTLKCIFIACALASSMSIAHSAEDKAFDKELNDANINYISSNGIIYLMDDTDPRKVCDIVDYHPDVNVRTVYNVKTLTDVSCK